MDGAMQAALTAVVQRLVQLAAEEPAFRDSFLALLEGVQVAIRNTGQEVEKQQVAAVPADAARTETPPLSDRAVANGKVAATTPPERAAPQAFPEPGPAIPDADRIPQPAWAAGGSPDDDDLKDVEARCRLKAKASRWAATRRRLLAAKATFRTEIEPTDRWMIEEGKARECYLWMCGPSDRSSLGPDQYDVIGDCFEGVAEALAFARLALDDADSRRGEFETSVRLLAEAQSALRLAVAQWDGNSDPDQNLVFLWLRRTTDERNVFVQRHMKRDDPADPSRAAARLDRIRAARADAEQARRASSQGKKLLGKIRHKVSLLPDAGDTEKSDLWRSLALIVDELVAGGLPPSDRQLREHLLPVIDGLPELTHVPKGFRLFLRELDRFRQGTPPPEEAPGQEEEPSEEVRHVGRFLAGRSMVLVGGDPRPEAKEALERAFGLRELIWVATREHQSVRFVEPAVARPEVAVVLLAIRWSGHAHGDVQTYCDRYGKALVRLPAGYNPNQVAVQVLMQCGERLSGD